MAEPSLHRPGFPLAAALAAGGLACAGRAALMAVKDGWWAAGQGRIAIASGAWNATAEIVPVLAAALALTALAWTGGRRLRAARVVAFAAALALAWLHVAARWPYSAFHAPGFEGSRALVAQGFAVLVAAAAAGLVVSAPPAGLARALGGLAAVALAAAVGVKAFAPGRGGGGGDAGDRPSVIVISLDTFRRDRAGCYGSTLGATPSIDRLAESSVLFEDPHSPEAWTLTAHMTLLTSLRPLAHGVGEDRPLPDGVPTLATVLRREGYATAALVDDVGWLHPFFGFDRGFDTYRRVRGDARAKNEALVPLLDDLEEGGRFFLLLHYFDAHGDWGRMPYEAPPADVERFAGWYQGDFDGCDTRGRCGADLLRAWTDEGTPPPEDVRRYVESLYDAGVAALDRELGALFAELEARGLLDRTLVVLTADHGEEFFEHGKALHRQLHVECTAVPLLVRPPGGTQARRAAGPVGLVDVAPTILELAGVEAPETMEGRSLVPALSAGGGALSAPCVVLESGEERSGLRTERYLLLRDGTAEQLFDLEADPGERDDLLARDAAPDEVLLLRTILDDETARDRGIHAGLGAGLGVARPRESLGAEERARLRGLGYVEGER